MGSNDLTLNHCNQIEEVYYKFLHFISFKCNTLRLAHSGYECILQVLNLEKLKDQRQHSYATFLNKLLINGIDDSFLFN